MSITDPDQLRTIAATLRAEAQDADEGADEGRIIADLFHAAASDDFLEFGDVRRVRDCIGQLAAVVQTAMAEEATAVAIGEDGTAYLDDDTEVPAGQWEATR